MDIIVIWDANSAGGEYVGGGDGGGFAFDTLIYPAQSQAHSTCLTHTFFHQAEV